MAKVELKNKHVTTLAFAGISFDVVDGVVDLPDEYIKDEYSHIFTVIKSSKKESTEPTKEVTEEVQEKPKRTRKA